MTTYDLSGTNYSESDSANSNAAPAGMPEGMAPSGVNDAWRSGMGAVKRAYDWDHAGTWVTIGGTADAVTLTYSVAPNAYVQGQKHAFKATANNTGATTVNVNSLGVKNIFKKTSAGVAACIGGEIENGDIVEIEYDGTQFQIVGQAANAGFAETAGTIASASTVGIGAAAANYLQITGTTAITAFDTIAAGTRRFLEFAGALTLTHNATSLILPGGASIATAAGDVAIMISEGSGNWRCVSYMKASGAAVAATFTAKYTSADATITRGAGGTFIHGLGVPPFFVEIVFVCQSAEFGYAVGDLARISPMNYTAAGRGYGLAWNGTTIKYAIGSDPSSLQVISLVDGSLQTLTIGSWKIRAVAWL
jgi:hypothetical protein